MFILTLLSAAGSEVVYRRARVGADHIPGPDWIVKRISWSGTGSRPRWTWAVTVEVRPFTYSAHRLADTVMLYSPHPRPDREDKPIAIPGSVRG
jgi:hypothetical protein